MLVIVDDCTASAQHLAGNVAVAASDANSIRLTIMGTLDKRSDNGTELTSKAID